MSLCAVINPTAEDAYWHRVFRDEPYYEGPMAYGDYSPAYRVGYSAPLRREGSFESLEEQLRQDWEGVKGSSRLTWPQARVAIRAAWDRVAEHTHPTEDMV
jgi:hypothetical protein